jgi:mannose-6-phosphate isomerase-like protein (cupin superfamily)
MSGIVRHAGNPRAHSSTTSEPRDCVEVSTLIEDDHYAEGMTNRVLRCLPGTSLRRRDDAADTYLFVLSGEGRLVLGGPDGTLTTDQPVAAGVAALIPAGREWVVVVESGELLITDTAVPAAPLPFASSLAREASGYQPLVRLGQAAREAATSAREFEVLYGPSRGSAGATQFVGYIPPSGAPSHYHLYDEICVIVRGRGRLHAAGEVSALEAGSTFHVPPRFLHAVENTQSHEDLWILGVFRPAGSAAAAYYPDGRPAPNNAPEDDPAPGDQ